MCIAIAWLVLAKTWKQPTCPSVDEWINKPWHSQTMGYLFSAKNKRPIAPQKYRQEILKHITK